MCVFFFNDTATNVIYTLSLPDALPISFSLSLSLSLNSLSSPPPPHLTLFLSPCCLPVSLLLSPGLWGLWVGALFRQSPGLLLEACSILRHGVD